MSLPTNPRPAIVFNHYELNNRLNTNAFVRYLLYLFFFLMLSVPTVYQFERSIFLEVLLALGLISTLHYRWVLNISVVKWLIIYISISILWIVYGILNGAPGALSVSTVYVFWPLMYFFVFGLAAFRNKIFYEGLFNVIAWASLIAAFSGILLVLETMKIINLPISNLLKPLYPSVGIYGKVIVYSMVNMATIIYGLGFLWAIILTPRSLGFKRKKFYIFALCICAIATLISGRKAMILVMFLSPVIVLFLKKMRKVKTTKKSRFLLKLFLFGLLGIGAAYFVINLFNTSIADVVSYVGSGFNFNDPNNLGASTRKTQFIELIKGWLEAPFFGAGHGAGVANSIRDPQQTWAYEITYIALLYQVGIVGFLIYASLICWIIIKSIKIMKTDAEMVKLLLPVNTGMIGFLIANATNPYLMKFDYLWVIFLPLGIINYYNLRDSQVL